MRQIWTNQDKRLLSLPEVAASLNVAEKTVQRMIQRGEIPCMKVAGQWRFSPEDLDAWLMSQKNGGEDALDTFIADSPENLPLSRLLSKNTVLLDIEAASREEACGYLIDGLLQAGAIADSKRHLEGVLRRETMASTALGQGIAFPHLRSPGENRGGKTALGICRLKEGVDWNAADDRPVDLIFLAVSTQEVVHLRILAALSRMIQQPGFVEEIRNVQSFAELEKIFLRREIPGA